MPRHPEHLRDDRVMASSRVSPSLDGTGGRHNLFDVIEREGPTEFRRAELEPEKDLFIQRAALFYTPTAEIPGAWVGAGPLKLDLPVAPPSRFEFEELRGYRSPRLWVDLLQRATWKIRWTPFPESRVRIGRYDISAYPYHTMVGAKGLLDALKFRTTGRTDGRLLYYFGAIEDDSPRHVIHYDFLQERVSHPAEARCTVEVQPA